MKAFLPVACLLAAACGGANNRAPATTVEPIATTNTTTTTTTTDARSAEGYTYAARPEAMNAQVVDAGMPGVPYPQPTPLPGSPTPPPTPVPGQPKVKNSTAEAQPVAPSGVVVVNNSGEADRSKRADNTGTNSRDANGGTMTPMNQGNSDMELKITANIRKSLVGDSALSFDAKNVKVITTGDKVTLRGPVKTAAEKTQIEAIARRTEGVRQIDNQLEVKK